MVSIIPGIESRAPERTETSKGFAESPNAEMRQHNAYHSFLVFLVLGCLLGEHPSHVGQ
jgi:hypothetical protein